ncbi:hypothetical protein BABINDRAFT_171283 [Babjeviella inositovora NRRL Y-12698]|uniref:Protein NRD1 n=1 Tax=Babjeviella inositovora NRRL Y-12698 TaxID=984486 RepID=A0A1E3QRN1_9ASCO|nr:uncharacterized protein BABINDRAFT_171283 [Babjeviella inositovora NRRL Y-12698]ODQ80355.1 hypothetical protein BABINDRAFT_171283 [Babjeviella inositovora NRRL Y-12698]
MSAVEEFETILKQLPTVKAPGVSGTRIRKLTELASKNVEMESQMVSKLYAHCKATPSTHKLGALYVLDSILRAYATAAQQENQTVGETAPDGTAAAGVFQISQVVDLLLKDSLEFMVDEDERIKVGKLLDIWEKTNTFEVSFVAQLRANYFPTTTPKGSPKASLVKPEAPAVPAAQPFVPPAPAAAAKDPASILAALANLADKSKSPSNPNTVLSANSSSSASSSATTADDPSAIFNMLQQMQKESAPAAPAPAPISLPPQDQVFNQGNQGGRNFDQPPQGHVVGERNTPDNPHFRPKKLTYDNLPAGSIKVFSRTLFLGGVPSYMDDRELMSVLRPFGEVQSVILNSERKHAFVKVYSRAEAESVINDFSKSSQLPIRVRWGVGFGPRECCDYQHGVSIIPISMLTEADKKWCVKAEWGGTDGVPLDSGMVMDEPDIEIGTGVSSKAISKKMPTNSARNGPKSNKPGEPEERYVSTDYRGGQQPGFMAGMGAANPLANMWGNNNGPQHQQGPPGMVAPGMQNQAPAQPDFAAMMQTMAAMNGGQAPDFNQMAAFFQQQQSQQR